MTEINVQKIHISNCEEWIAHEYFLWGSEDALQFDEAKETQKAERIGLGYEMYDGCLDYEPHDLTAADVAVTIAVGSGVKMGEVLRFLKLRKVLSPVLKAIPEKESLLDGDEGKIKVLAHALDLFRFADKRAELVAEEELNFHGFNWSRVTKILNRKRPAFIPVVDSHVHLALWANFPHLVLRQHEPTGDYLLLFRDILLFLRSELTAIRSNVAAKWGIDLTEVRLLSSLLYQWRRKSSATRGKQEFREYADSMCLSEPWTTRSALWGCKTSTQKEYIDSSREKCPHQIGRWKAGA